MLVMTFLHMESWLIRETGVVWRARAEQCFSPVIGVAFSVFEIWGLFLLCLSQSLTPPCEMVFFVKTFMTDVGSDLV